MYRVVDWVTWIHSYTLHASYNIYTLITTDISQFQRRRGKGKSKEPTEEEKERLRLEHEADLLESVRIKFFHIFTLRHMYTNFIKML